MSSVPHPEAGCTRAMKVPDTLSVAFTSNAPAARLGLPVISLPTSTFAPEAKLVECTSNITSTPPAPPSAPTKKVPIVSPTCMTVAIITIAPASQLMATLSRKRLRRVTT